MFQPFQFIFLLNKDLLNTWLIEYYSLTVPFIEMFLLNIPIFKREEICYDLKRNDYDLKGEEKNGKKI
ncbi:MAG TPA: hypothetical protein VK115_00675 [Staphylococcus sp.]|nr:hypothetical protein [Staphylococcus sp.]